MPTVASFDKERLEVEAILASGIFSRAPNLALLLKYVCGKYFDGAAEDIKEYNIAIEALGRSPEFDQKRDSIVRVEAHRLRKRLKDYYETDGADHEIQIEIPSGQYTPRFVLSSVSPADPTPAAAAPASHNETSVTVPLPPAVALPMVAAPRSRMPLLATLAIGLFIVGLLWSWNRAHQGVASASSGVVPATALPGDEVRILCGVENGSYIDAFERTWQGDRFFQGGSPSQAPRNQIVLGTRDQQLYRNRREGQFRYDIPLKAGVYELRLYFAETMFGENNVAGGGETTRLFEIHINGKTVVNYFDVIADAGPSTADIKVYKDISPAPDGKLHLEFSPNTNPAFLNAIAIVPGVPGKMRPYRIVARDRGLKDNEGRQWEPDWYARGGQLISRPDSNVPGPDPELFRSERFGNLTYSIPVAPNGKYGVNLYFAENWFGPGNPGAGGAGSRTFDILLNGVMLRKNFDILKEAGGINKAVIVSEHGVEPNHQAKIVIAMPPSQNYACINALEVVDESK